MPFQTYNNARDDIRAIDNDLSQGHVSIQEASQAVKDMNSGWDKFASNADRLGFDLTDFAKDTFGKNTFEAFGGIKNGAVIGVNSVSSFFSAIDSFDGSWRNPAQARQKIETGLRQISTSVRQLGATLENVKRTGSAISNAFGIGNPGIDLTTGEAVLNHPVLDGIGTFEGGLVGFSTAFNRSGIIGMAGRMTEDISRKVNGNPTGGAASINFVNNENSLQDNGSDKITPSTNQKNVLDKDSKKGHQIEHQNNVGTQKGADTDDFSADMIHEINVVIEGVSSSKNSQCTINGVPYRLSGYSLSQDLLQPMILNLSIEKEEKIETQSDVIFADATQLIGKSFEMNVSTIKSSQEDNNATPKPAFIFKGMIIDVAASRSTACSQSANITIASWDSLLQNAPHCRSFENMTLKDIISFVLKPYKEIKSKIQPRFNEKIPYIVQYNQSDYAFISMLAIRFGEWMYNNGQEFIFGELDECPSSAISLEYPGGSLMSYSLHQGLNDFAFNHLLVDHYQFGKNNGVIKVSAQGISDGNVNDWTDKAFQASQQRYANSKISALSAGGFDSGQDDEGADAILNYSLKTEAQGKKTELMTVQGYSKLALLQIGQTFLIRDNIQNKSGENQDVEQKALKIISINHSFDYNQEYSNNFTAVPVACNYPAYSDADIHAVSPSQRAKVIDNKDTQKLGRIKVQFPWQEVQDKQMITPWLRIAVPYAGKNKGEQFIPEIGEEVMVGFEMNNAERPYIIGALYNGGEGKSDEKWASSEEQNGTSNNIKAIRTRNGHTILFNDKGNAGLLEIYDNNNNTYHITLSADDKKITIYSAGEIEVVADGDINVTSKGNIGVNADGNVGIKSKGSISMEAKKEVSIQASKVKVR